MSNQDPVTTLSIILGGVVRRTHSLALVRHMTNLGPTGMFPCEAG